MILEQIIEDKKIEVAERKSVNPFYHKKFSDKAIGRFKEALAKPGMSLIAEVKKASPSKGTFLNEFDPVKLATCYEKAGASAISVLTETKYFQASSEYLMRVKEAVTIPILRKDFIIDPYQIYETRDIGADALLLITAILSKQQLRDYILLTKEVGLDALVEVHSQKELEVALSCGAEIIGINNRDLKTFKTDINNTMVLAHLLSNECILVSESGIATGRDVQKLARVGVDAILVGEALVTSNDLESKVRELVGVNDGDLG